MAIQNGFKIIFHCRPLSFIFVFLFTYSTIYRIVYNVEYLQGPVPAGIMLSYGLCSEGTDWMNGNPQALRFHAVCVGDVQTG